MPDEYSSGLDLIRKFKLSRLSHNPFAISRISTKMDQFTPWSLDPILTQQVVSLRDVTRNLDGTEKERMKGLFSNAIMWLLKNLGIKVLNWAHNKWGDKQRGLDKNDYEESSDSEIAYSFMMARDSTMADIEQNPGPVQSTVAAEDTTG